MKTLKHLLILFPILLVSCGEQTETIEAKTVQLMRAVCDPVSTPVSLMSSSKDTIIVEDIYKVGVDGGLYHVNGNIYIVPEDFKCKFQMLPDRYACVSAEDLNLLYDGPCKFKKEE